VPPDNVGEELKGGTDNPTFPDRIPAFQLFDPFKRFDRKRYAKTIAARPLARSRLVASGLLRSPERPAKPVPSPDDDLPARAICLRLLGGARRARRSRRRGNGGWPAGGRGATGRLTPARNSARTG
jgi:hypothetical protein